MVFPVCVLTGWLELIAISFRFSITFLCIASGPNKKKTEKRMKREIVATLSSYILQVNQPERE